jgi:16S rRNA (cytosine967-C5)-methyltransferase
MSRKPNARDVAWNALQRVDMAGGYANLVVPSLLDESNLEARDRGFVTEMVYGATRMRRACDFAFDRFLMSDPPAELRSLLRLGAYQLVFMGVAPHAAVGESVEIAPKKWKPVVNAVLRKVVANPPVWPDEATRLSYPDWLVERFVAELGHDDAMLTLAKMNEVPPVTLRDDGYTQDRSSTWVADLVGAQSGELIADLCAAPGGKATRMAGEGAHVIALDRAPHRAGLVKVNARRIGVPMAVVVGDAAAPPLQAGVFDRVLVDAPCSGLGALRRRADARWRVKPKDIVELVAVQARILRAARELVKPGGTLVYSVCTITAAESIDHDNVANGVGSWPALEAPGDPWRPFGRGARVLAHDDDTDGMIVIRWTRPRS